MDPLSALAIAAAVVQFVEIGGKVLVRCWDKYHALQNPEDLYRRDPEEEAKTKLQLEERVASLNIFVSEAQLPSIEDVDSQPRTHAQQQLINAAYECSRIRFQVDEVATRFIPPPKNETEVKASRPHGLFSRSKKQEPDVNPKVTRAEIERIEKHCEFVRSQAMDSILMCLWENSKQTKQWEVHFGKQLGNAISLLENIDKNTNPSTENSSYLALASSSTMQNGTAVDISKFRVATLPLAETGSSISMADLGKEMAEALRTGVARTQNIRNELVEVLWRRDWEMDMSIPGVSPIAAPGTRLNLDTDMVAQATSTGVRFEVIDTREEAIPKTYGSTYRWVFETHPPTKAGKPLWESFPAWLIDSSKPTYWITGKPGSGKSTMMKFLLQQPLLKEYLSRELGTLCLLIVRYYAWNAGKNLQKSFLGFKKTLISQALNFCPELAWEITPRRWVLCQTLRTTSCLPGWELWEIEETFEALLAQCGKTIKLALFIDGLDEFETPPQDVIKEIRKIAAHSTAGLKICVASRPWNTFNDEYGYGPSLEMHLVTYKDMVTFVSGNFKENRAFAEHEALDPHAATQLVDNVVMRANGVFQWVSLVVPLLLELLTDGESPTHSVDIQQVLEDLPSELETLYETIWARIRPENLHNASFMMQIMRAAEGPLSWLNMWVVEDLRQASARAESASALNEMSSESIEQFRGDSHARKVAKGTLKRKLVGRTKGILELNLEGDGFVDFIHRTARDWAANPTIWDSICKASKEPFDPHLYLLQADILTLSYWSCTWSNADAQLREAIMSAFLRASKVEFNPENNNTLVKCLTSFEKKCQALERDPSARRKTCWAPADFPADNTFVGLAAQFSILPYVEFALQTGQPHKPLKGTLNLLENAIFGPRYYNPPTVPPRVQDAIPQERRLATIRYLLENGVYQSKVHTWNGVRDLKDELQSISPTVSESDYYATVLGHLNGRGKRSQMRLTLTSASEQLRSQMRFFKGKT